MLFQEGRHRSLRHQSRLRVYFVIISRTVGYELHTYAFGARAFHTRAIRYEPRIERWSDKLLM